MPSPIEIMTQCLVDTGAFDNLHFKARAEIGRRLAAMGERYAAQVSGSGLAEAGIRSRTGAMGRSIKTANRTTPAYIKTVIYPTAKDAVTGYGYAYALGLGSPRNATMVRSYVRGSGGRTFRAYQEFLVNQSRKTRPRKLSIKSMTYAKIYKNMTHQRRSEMVEVKEHHRGVNLKARPFMGGSAWSRLESGFSAEMTDALASAIQQSIHEKAIDAAASATDFDGAGVG